MPKRNLKDEIDELPFEDLILGIERNKRDIASRWIKGKLYGAGARNAPKLEHKQVRMYDRLVDELLGPGWEEELEFVEYIARWIAKKKVEYLELKHKIS
ncbi:MAG: hypothetical protein ACREOP_01835 [Thermodesulfobacteriota bacterium]